MKTDKPSSSKKSTRFNSVLDMVKKTAEESHIKEFEDFLATTTISRSLIKSRAKAGLTQADVAEKMGCSQSAVSKLEHSTDGDLKISEIVSFVRAVNGRLGILCGKPPTITERIKGHVLGLRAEIKRLSEMNDNNDDPTFRAGINQFGEEVWINTLLVFLQAAEKFTPSETDIDTPLLSVVDDSMEPVTRTGPDCKCRESP